MTTATPIKLAHGAHRTRADGVCAAEAVAWLAGESHTDHPACLSRIIGTFVRRWNDALDDGNRQQLVPLLPLMIGTATGAADDEQRAWLALDWLVRTHTPAWLRLVPSLTHHADALAALAPIDDPMALSEARAAVRAAAADASWAAVRAAALDAAGVARAAALDAAWGAAGAAARDAAWAAARDAALDAAWGAAGAAARDAAWAAARDAAWAAARAAAWAAARAAAWDAARVAEDAEAALRPTVIELQSSACDLIRRMCAVAS